MRDHWDDRQRYGQAHSHDLSENGVRLTGCKQPEIERSGRVVVPAEKTSSRQKDHQSIEGSELYMLEKKLRDVEGNTLSLDEGHSLRLRAMKVFHR
ncbi:unnamed protein product [Heligmosomoides polygyrus]|uniref:Transposase n=1 Tax=Heligmosomoides polygyrus TaxID=6339 RepID=A0A183GJ32_HELPZ|nr:unnamed protein product [Heligmosomoides polygyrus]